MTQIRRPEAQGAASTQQGGLIRAGVWVAPESRFGARWHPGSADHLSAAVPLRSYNKGAFIYRQGDLADGFYVVLAGSVKIVAPGSDRVLAVCGPDDVFGAETSTPGTQPRQHRSEAISVSSRTQVACVSDAQFREAARQDPELACVFANVLAQRVQVLEEEAERARLPAQARLARTLLSLAERFGTEHLPGLIDLELDLRQDDIASLAGAKRVSATRALSAWRELGLVRGTRGSYRINVRGLSELIELLEEEHAV